MICMLYIPCSNRLEAETISKTLLEEKLIGCANIISSIDSIYIWQGRIEQTQECILLLKTVPEFKSRTTRRIEQLHSYSCPCVMEWSIASINTAYEEWIRQSLGLLEKNEE